MRLGGESEPTRQHYWSQMGEQNRYNEAGVNDEEAYLDSGFPRSDWNLKITVGQIFSSKKALLTELRFTALRGHFEFKVQFSCTKRLLMVCCQRPCPWRVRASRIGEYSFMIVRCTTVHECDLRGFRSSMRPVIALDATHLKSKYKGVMFVANAFDGNRNIYPLAFGIGDLETDASWHWFFTKLHEAIGECPNLVIISDRNVSIENAAKSYSIAEFDCHFRNIKRKEHVAQYLEEAGLYKWSRAHMDGRRYNVMTTNIAESINSVLRFARMLPVVHLIGEIVNLLVKWFTERRELALNCTTTLCPNFGEKKLRNRLEDAARMNVVKLNNAQFNVLDGDKDGLVDLTNNSCSCRKFQLEQLPCKHVVAVCRFLKVNVYSKASRYYTRKTWMDAYSDSIYLVQPHEMWDIPEDVRSRVVLPPMARVMPGRRKKIRIPSQGEGTIRRKCSRCGSAGHNKSTCKNNIPLRNVS
ncbi:uncharacterized protein LOC109947187 [Prunus persica]|uniref:uncharacterized protein LOC109947187 n=1 Tax=Prunus persica TaxID=3760 RepID=UPI0009AB9D5A|nr:uncharacterized protein LOC109947187 [Prunus persica]